MHKSVLLEECIKYLNLEETSVIVDATLGYGGHSSEILKKIKRGFLFAFDQDEEAIAYSDERLKKISNNFEIIKSNFVNMQDELLKRNVSKVDGILFDLGVSSPQLDEQERGFSFHKDAKLDMRMDKASLKTAYDVVNNYDEKTLINILREYGEEKYAYSIVKGIAKARNEKPIETTLELVEIIKNHVPMKYRINKHPARKTFQALRIEVNNELEVFEKALYEALDLVGLNKKVAVITFHSLEDKICKRIFKEESEIKKELHNLPIIPDEFKPRFKMIANIEPSEEEINSNNRSRSARLRVIEKIKE
ncbi:MAG: 16S rRNA (cytosine(1402)-N(4))-methyltransferase RsmH [Bacilli bacterium]|nr:16S rRNA (cytosine(1402)-N(4))-methyltransferase RsmH [Bacilli bacterium]